MKQEIKDRWTTGLRSNEYEQGRLKFKDGDKFCCLGVLCDVMGQPTEGRFGAGNWRFAHETLRGSGVDAHALAELNDSKCMSFPEIADWIDENVAVTP